MTFGPEIVIGMALAGVNVTFGVIGFFEYAYRKRIEQNRTKLLTYAKTQLKDVLGGIKLPLTSGEIQSFKEELEGLSSVVNRPDDFLKWRNYLLGLMVLQVLISIYAVFNSNTLAFSYPPEDWAGFFLAIVFVADVLYLREVWRIDSMTQKELKSIK